MRSKRTKILLILLILVLMATVLGMMACQDKTSEEEEAYGVRK